jgi:hypothetical protein
MCFKNLIPDDGGSTHLWNIGRQSFYTAVYPRRLLWTKLYKIKLKYTEQSLLKHWYTLNHSRKLRITRDQNVHSRVQNKPEMEAIL